MTSPSPEGSRRREALDEVTLSAFQITAALIVILDREGRIVRFNPACERFTGWTEADVQGQLLWPLVLDEQETARAQQVFAHLTPRTDVITYENTWLNHAGERRDLHWRVTFLPGADDEIDLIVSTGIDVTGERQVQRALQDSETLFRTLFRYSADGVVLIDPHDPVIPWRIVRCNPAFARMNGYEPQDLIGQSIDLLRGDDLTAQRGATFLSWIRDHPDGAHSQATHRHRDGHLLHVDRSSTVVTVDGQELVLALDRDVTAAHQQEAQLQRANAHLAYLAQHDELTGLLSRNAWLARLGEMRRAPGCHVALFLDLDAFKQVNDTYGHAVGDEVLQAVAARLLAEVRPSDAVGRLGGDEFLVALTLPDDTQIEEVVARLERVISAPYRLSGLEVRVGVSIGAAVASEDLDVDVALRRADHEMYRVKRTRSA